MNIPCTDSRAAKCHQHPTRSVDWTTAGVVWVLISIFQSCLHQRVGTSIIQQGGPLLFPVAYLLTYLSLSATSLDLFSCLRICFSALLSITCVCFLSSVVFGDCASPFLSRANLPRPPLSLREPLRQAYSRKNNTLAKMGESRFVAPPFPAPLQLLPAPLCASPSPW